jgi:hypothetical protein
MNQIRFTIGVPKAGSAARIAEEPSDSPTRSILPRAGSSARDAEERKRLEGTPVRRSASISMRASGGRVAEPVAQTTTLADKAGVTVARSQANGNLPSSLLNNSSRPVVAAAPPGQSVADGPPTGPLQTAAVRLKSLVQSLFLPGAPSNES